MSISETCTVLKNAATIGARVLWEKVNPPPPALNRGDVPQSAEAVTTTWLTEVLCHSHPGAKVESIRVYGGSDGTSSRRAMEVTYNAVGQSAGLPTKLFTKAASSFSTRLQLGLTGIGECEAIFYNHIRPTLNLRSPKSYYAAYDPKTYNSLVILDDLSHVGYTFPNPLQNPISRQDAEDMVEQMAIYHESLWDSEVLTKQLAGLRNPLQFQTDLNRCIAFCKRTLVGIERARAVLPESIYARKKEIWPALMRSLELNTQGPQTLVHQDTHPGNWLRDGDGRMGLYDWQVVARGGWAIDYAYAIPMALTVEDRRNWEEDLLKLYLEHLKANGVKNSPSFDEAWTCYRQQVFHGIVFGIFTLGRGPLQPKMQPDEYSLHAIARSSQAMEDLKSLDLVK